MPFDLGFELDQHRAKRLRAMKRSAGGLLLVAAAVFAATHMLTDGTGVAGYVRAAAEAAMVGGLVGLVIPAVTEVLA